MAASVYSRRFDDWRASQMVDDKTAVLAALSDADEVTRCRTMAGLETADIDHDIRRSISQIAQEDTSVQCRLTAVRKLAAFWPAPDVLRLFKTLAVDPEIQVADAVVGAMCRAKDQTAREMLLEAYLKAPHFGYKWLVFEGMTSAWSFSEIESMVLGYFIADSDEVVRASTVAYLGRQQDANVIADLIQLLNDSDARVRANAIEALGHFKLVVDRDVFMRMLTDTNHRVQSAAMCILHEMGGIPLDGAITKMVKSNDELARASAVYVLRQRKEFPQRRELLEDLADDRSATVQRQLALVG